MRSQAPLTLHVVYCFAVGGLENGLVNLVNRLPRDAWRHAIVSLTDVDATFARVEQRFSPARMVERYRALYLAAAAGSSSCRHAAETLTRQAPH